MFPIEKISKKVNLQVDLLKNCGILYRGTEQIIREMECLGDAMSEVERIRSRNN